MEANPYIETCNGGYYVTGTRIGLDTIVYAFRRGRTAEDIFEAYPSIGSLAEVYGVITFILEHPTEISSYLADQDQLFEEIKRQYPMPQDLIDRFDQGKENLRNQDRIPLSLTPKARVPVA